MKLLGICTSDFVGYTASALYMRIWGEPDGSRDRVKYVFDSAAWN